MPVARRLLKHAAMRASSRSRSLSHVAALAALLTMAACADERADEVADPLADALGPEHDECAVRGWYADGTCDQSCANHDPDCDDLQCEDACAELCDATWSGAAAPALPDGCTAESCDCGEPPPECPDVCDAECAGEPRPDVPAGCPDLECDCAEVLADPGEDVAPLLRAAARERCGTPTPSPAKMAEVNAEDRAAAARASVSAVRTKQTVPVVIHIIRGPRPDHDGDITNGRIAQQMRILNRAYSRSNFRFRLERVARITNGTWLRVSKDSDREDAIKRKLHAGNRRTLNVYTAFVTDSEGDPINGWATFPEDINDEREQDGVFMDASTTPGGFLKARGTTLVHEVGHWLGLYHVFQGECGSAGDGVADTAPAYLPGHCEQLDSCPDQRGVDPMLNFMNYGDACRNHFTPGQRARMTRRSTQYRQFGAADEPEPDRNRCGDRVCAGDEDDSTCPADCGCAATGCTGIAPIGCYCDATCAAEGDCCEDAMTCEAP